MGCGAAEKVDLPLMIQDPAVAAQFGIRPTDGFHCTLETTYCDGPVSDRVAVVDLDPETGELVPGVPFVPPREGRVLGKFDVPRDPEYPRHKRYLIDTRAFNQASVYGAVLRTMKLFEHKNVLGRPVSWAFDGPQLLVVPRAGEWANAFYQRESRSLQFFYVRPDPRSEPIFTSLSRDIVAHETAHAILDGIAPDLYDAHTPESLAIHEAVADLVAVMMAAESSRLIEAVLSSTRGAVESSTPFSSIAAQFGAALDRTGKAKYLRQLANRKALSDVSATEPHELSEVLSGALFRVLMKMHEAHRVDLVEEERWQAFPDPWYSCSGRAFTAACFRLRNAAFQALEYLPPGEVSFADYARAILAVNAVGRLNPRSVSEWLRDEFLERGIVDDLSELSVETDLDWAALRRLDLETFLKDDAVAADFAETQRTYLHVPPGVALDVRPRQVIEKTYYDIERNEIPTRECLFKVSWEELEGGDQDFPPRAPRAVRLGTTLVIDLISGRARALLTSDRHERQRLARATMFRELYARGVVQFDERALGPDGTPLESAVQVLAKDGILRVRGAARLLHIVPSEI